MEATQIPLEGRRHLLTRSHMFQTHIHSTGQHFPFNCLFLLIAESQAGPGGARTIWPTAEEVCRALLRGAAGARGEGVRRPTGSPAQGWLADSGQVASHPERWLAYPKNETTRPASPRKTFPALTSFQPDKILQSPHKHLLWSGSYQKGSKLLS